MSFQTDGHSKIRAAMADLTHPDYDQLPEAVKMVHSPAGYAWLGNEERARVIEMETMPDMDVTE